MARKLVHWMMKGNAPIVHKALKGVWTDDAVSALISYYPSKQLVSTLANIIKSHQLKPNHYYMLAQRLIQEDDKKLASSLSFISHDSVKWANNIIQTRSIGSLENHDWQFQVLLDQVNAIDSKEGLSRLLDHMRRLAIGSPTGEAFFLKNGIAFYLEKGLEGLDHQAFREMSSMVTTALAEKTPISQWIHECFEIHRYYTLKGFLKYLDKLDHKFIIHEYQHILIDHLKSEELITNHQEMELLLDLVLKLHDNTHSKYQNSREIFNLYEDCILRGHIPRANQFNRLLEIISKEGTPNIGLCLLIMDKVKQYSKPNADTFKWCFHAMELFPERLKISQITKLEDEMMNLNINHSLESASAVILALLKHGYYEGAFQRLSDMRLNHMERPLQLYHQIFYYSSLNSSSALYCLRDLRFSFIRDGHRMTSEILGLLIDCATQSGDLLAGIVLAESWNGDFTPELKEKLANLASKGDEHCVAAMNNLISDKGI